MPKTATHAPAAANAAPQQHHSLVVKFANKYSLEAPKLLETLKATAFKVKNGEVSNEQMAALLIVADQYGLNPFTREIFAFPDKQNGIVPVVSVDGWTRIINEHPQMDGLEFRYSEATIDPIEEQEAFPGLKWEAHEWIECVIYRKDRTKPYVIREYFEEVYRPPYKGEGPNGSYTVNGPWQSHSKRFHRHKTLIQAARLAFGFAGIYDEDEAGRILDAAKEINPVAGVTMPSRKSEGGGTVIDGESTRQPESQQGNQGASDPASGGEGGGEVKKDEPPVPMTDGMKKTVRSRLEGAEIKEEQLTKQFGKPLDELPASQVNDVLAWIKEMVEARG